MKERLEKSFDANYKKFKEYFGMAITEETDKTDYIIATAEFYGKCSILSQILGKEFSVDKKEEMEIMKDLMGMLY